MLVSKEVARHTAELLLQIKAIKLEPNNPFTWASGWKSPIYCDNRTILSFPKVRTFIRQELAKGIEEQFGKPEVVAGVATGAIAHGVLTAQAMDLPFVYVRPKAKEHGMGNQVEGQLDPESSVVVVEDLISTGMSSLNAVEALKQAEANVKGMMAIFTYGFPVARENFSKADCDLFTLCDYETLITHAGDTNYISAGSMDTLMKWREAPDKWEP